mgnify:CR=1 FL=1
MNIFPVTRFGTTPFDMISVFDKIFDDTFSTREPAYKNTHAAITTVPRANVVKSNKGYAIELAAPGFSRDEFIIDVENNTLSISVSTEDSTEYANTVQMREYKYNSFSRSWALPEGANVNAISATYDAGILNVSIPVEGIKETKRTIAVD